MPKTNTTFNDEVDERMDCGFTRENAHIEIDDLIDDGYFSATETRQLRRGLIGVGYYVEVPEPPKTEVTVLGPNGCRTTTTNRHDYVFKMNRKFYTRKDG